MMLRCVEVTPSISISMPANHSAKADKYGLPRVLVFCDGGTKPVLKAMSTEYRRRLLVAEIRKNRKNRVLIQRYKVVGMSTQPRVHLHLLSLR